MAADTLRPPPSLLSPPFPRSTSLFIPERLADSVLDGASYSPFPTFPGSSHARDPYGLNAFLMNPSDSLWEYMQPAPAASPTRSSSEVSSSPSSGAEEEGVRMERKNSLRKQMSMGNLRQGSPLAKPLNLEEGDPTVTVVRRRSKSVGSATALSKSVSPTEEHLSEMTIKSKPPPPKSLRKVFGKARKTILGPASNDTTSSKSTPPLVDEIQLPVVTYTPLNNSHEISSSKSSSSSSEGVITPSEKVSDPAVAIKLADALEAGVNKKSWLGWLGGRRGPKSKDPSPASSRGSSPNGSTTSLPSKVSPSPEKPIALPASRVSPPPDRPKTYTWVGAALRSASLRKATTIRRPGPHPLAMQLAIQHGHLPEEIAFALRAEAGQRVYPRSVNSPSHTLGSGQGGLRVTLGIRFVLSQLDRGLLPPGVFSPTPSPNPKSSARPKSKGPKGMCEFVKRPPFEDRMMVFYPDDKFSMVSMARPGFGIWDLDYSTYVLVLASLGDGEGASWKNTKTTPRTKDVRLPSPDLPNTDVEILVTPPQMAGDLLAPAAVPSPIESPSMTIESEVVPEEKANMEQVVEETEDSQVVSSFKSRSKSVQDRPLSSFQNAPKSRSAEWEDSDSDESDQETMEDDKPLAMVMKRNSSMPNVTAPLRNRPLSMMPSLPSGQAMETRARNRSSADHASRRISEIDRKLAKGEVVKARGRRELLLSGEIERRVEAQLEMDKSKKRASIPPKRASVSTSNIASQASGAREKRMSTHTLRESVSSPSSPARRRTQSTFEVPPSRPTVLAHVRTSTSPPRAAQLGERRYHSFYELPQQSASFYAQDQHRWQGTQMLPAQGYYMPPPPSMMYPHPQAVYHPAAPPMVYGMPHSGSMVLHPPQTAPPQGYALPNSFSRSNLSLPQKPARRSS